MPHRLGGGDGNEGIMRPMVLLGNAFGVPSVPRDSFSPKSRQVLRDLNWLFGWGEKMEHQGSCPPRCGGFPPEHFLNLDAQDRLITSLIVNAKHGAARNGDVGGS